jgi:hypothetical protein
MLHQRPASALRISLFSAAAPQSLQHLVMPAACPHGRCPVVVPEGDLGRISQDLPCIEGGIPVILGLFCRKHGSETLWTEAYSEAFCCPGKDARLERSFMHFAAVMGDPEEVMVLPACKEL